MESNRESAVELIAYLPEGVRIVSMVQFRDTIYVATERGVYRLVKDEFHPVEFTYVEGTLKPPKGGKK